MENTVLCAKGLTKRYGNTLVQRCFNINTMFILHFFKCMAY